MQHNWLEARSRPDPSLRGTRLNTALCLKNTLQMFPPSSKKTPTLPWVVDLCAALCMTHAVVACASKESPRSGYWSPLSFLELPFYYLFGKVDKVQGSNHLVGFPVNFPALQGRQLEDDGLWHRSRSFDTCGTMWGESARNLPTTSPWSFKEVHERLVWHDNGIVLY